MLLISIPEIFGEEQQRHLLELLAEHEKGKHSSYFHL